MFETVPQQYPYACLTHGHMYLCCPPRRKVTTIATEPSFFTVLWNQKLVVAGIMVVAAVFGFGLSMLQPETYKTEATVLITDPNTAQELTDQMGLERSAWRNVNNQAALMESIDSAVSVTPERDTGIVIIHGNSSTAAGAVHTVDAMFAEYSAVMQATAEAAAAELFAQLDKQQARVEDEIAQLDAEILAAPDDPTLRPKQVNAINELRVIARTRTRIENQLTTYGNGVQEYASPETPAVPSGPSPISNAIIAAVLGLLVATGVAWVRGADA